MISGSKFDNKETLLNSTPQIANPINRPTLSLAVILIGSFMAPLLMHSSTLAIPAIAEELKLNAEHLSWFTLLNVLGNAMLVLPAGKLADIYGRRRIFCFGLLASGLACVIGGLATSSDILLLGRFVQGIGGAFIFGSSIALVSSIPPEDKKQQVMGIYIAICYLGIVAGPLFGGVVLQYMDWRWVFHVPAIILLATCGLGFGLLHWERFGDRDSKLRILDTSLYMLALVLIAVAVFRTNELSGQLLLASGISLFIGFCWFQSKRRDPLLQVTLFRDNLVYATLAITHFLTYCAMLSLPFTATLYLQYIKGLDPQTTGFILIVQAFATAVTSLAGGWLVRRIRVRVILIFGTSIIVAAMTILAFIDPNMPIWLIVFALGLIGLGIGLVDTQLLSVTMGSVPERLLGSASATLNGMRTMGGFVGIGIVSYLLGSSIGKQEITPDIYPLLMLALQNFFIIAAILTCFALLTLISGIVIRSRMQTKVPHR
jgi:MFS family permease